MKELNDILFSVTLKGLVNILLWGFMIFCFNENPNIRIYETH